MVYVINRMTATLSVSIVVQFIMPFIVLIVVVIGGKYDLNIQVLHYITIVKYDKQEKGYCS